MSSLDEDSSSNNFEDHEEEEDILSDDDQSNSDVILQLEGNQVKQIEAILLRSNNEEISRHIICGLNEDTQHLLKTKKCPFIPLQYYQKHLTIQQMQDNFNIALGTGEVKHHWQYSLDIEEMVFIEYEGVNGYGCQHYITNCKFFCQTCQQYFGCKYCHDEHFGYEDEPHDLKLCNKIKCLMCDTEQEYHENCIHCQKQLFNHGCNICGYSTINTKFFHCEKCNCCCDGDVEHFQHCDKCNSCVQKSDLQQHSTVCGKQLSDVCQLCLGEFDVMFMKRQRLMCSHDVHANCFLKLKQNSNNNQKKQCPLCKKSAQTITENAAEYQKFISIYAMTEIPQFKLGKYNEIECQNCMQKFVKHWHPKGYICPFCDSVNCTEGKEYEDAEKGQQLVQEQYKYIREEKKQIPIYPLILWPKDDYGEMAEMIQDYVDKYQNYWIECRKKMITCPFEMPLRELVNAYCLVRDIDEQLGFAALNLCHTRKLYPEPDAQTGQPIGLDDQVCSAIAEVREVRKLNLQ